MDPLTDRKMVNYPPYRGQARCSDEVQTLDEFSTVTRGKKKSRAGRRWKFDYPWKEALNLQLSQNTVRY